MLHEQVRIYKRELYEAQASNTAHNRHVVRLQAEAKRMHVALQARKHSFNLTLHMVVVLSSMLFCAQL